LVNGTSALNEECTTDGYYPSFGDAGVVARQHGVDARVCLAFVF
jgi:hypothetical protein